MTTALIALGSNIEDRRVHIARAVAMLREIRLTRVVALADAIETEPVNCPPGSSAFLNTAATAQTELTAIELFEQLERIERSLGRVRTKRNSPRTIDLDLLLFGDQIVHLPRLTVPHPRMLDRPFVLIPAAQIAPEMIHPLEQITLKAALLRFDTTEGPK